MTPQSKEVAGLGPKTTSWGFQSCTLSHYRPALLWGLKPTLWSHLWHFFFSHTLYLTQQQILALLYFIVYIWYILLYFASAYICPESYYFSLPLLPPSWFRPPSFGLDYCRSLWRGLLVSSLELLLPPNLICFQYSSQSNVTSLLRTHH